MNRFERWLIFVSLAVFLALAILTDVEVGQLENHVQQIQQRIDAYDGE